MNIVIKPIYKHLKPVKWYNDLYSKIVKEEADWWRDGLNHTACNPKPEQLKELKELLIRKKPDITDQEVWESNHSLMTFDSLAMSHAYIKLKEKKKERYGYFLGYSKYPGCNYIAHKR